MRLGPGTRLGPYEIQSAIGAGGMGEVYRATDTALGRHVAIKVLPDAFAQDAERLARFEREAKTLAALNHPNIAQIYGFETSSGTQALVLELVDGDTLADRIARGPIPFDEALPIARQIAEAIEAAHEQGIIHRDLKPANIKVTPDGQVKVLDFGLAKLAETADSRQQAADNAATVSPTMTSPGMITGVGVLLGTAAYMSPEQAKGRAADKRSDIWAFGCVLFEMLAGRRPFEPPASVASASSSGEGEDVTDTLAAILMREPDWAALPASTSPAIRVLLRHCLEKNRRERIADVSAIRFVLAEYAAMSAGSTERDPGYVRKDRADEQTAAAVLEARVALARSHRRGVAIASAAAIVATAAIVGAAVWFGVRPSSQSLPVVRFQIPAPGTSDAEMFTLSSDGRYLAFIANTGGPNQIWVRAMDTLEARAIAGTDGAAYPFWSPDGAYLGFFAQNKLKKIPVGGGPAQTLCDATAPVRIIHALEV